MRSRLRHLLRPLTLLVLLPLLALQPDGSPADDLAARKKKLKQRGGSAKTEEAVLRGLRWLARHQDADGKWNVDQFDQNCQDKEAKCDGVGFPTYDAGVTGLALLAFLGTGHTHQGGDFQDTVARGLGWIQSLQKEGGQYDGALGYVEVKKGIPKEEWVYNHAICTMAICEAYALTEDSSLKTTAERAVTLIQWARDPELAWRYGIRSDDNDTSVTGWMVQALKSAERAGLRVSEAAYEGAREWLDKVTAKSGVTGYRAPDGASSYLPKQQGKYDPVPCMTAVALFTRILTGQRKSETVIGKGKKILRRNTPTWAEEHNRNVNMYYWYYGTYAMFQFGGSTWRNWNKAMQKALLPKQKQEGEADGSWDPVGEWGIAGGRIYSTAISVLTLESYYRYDRIR